MAISFDTYKKYYLEDEENKKAVQSQKDIINRTYDTADKLYQEQYDQSVADAIESSEALYDANAVQRMINERQIAESMANSGLTRSGMNASQMTASALSYGNQNMEISRAQQKTIDTLANTLRSQKAASQLERESKLNEVDTAFNDSANTFATEQVEKMNTALEKAATERNTERRNLLDILADPNKDLTYKKSVYNEYRYKYPTADAGDSILEPYLSTINVYTTTDEEGNDIFTAANYTTENIEYYKRLWNSRNVTEEQFNEAIADFASTSGMSNNDVLQFVSEIKGNTARDTSGTVNPSDYTYTKISDGNENQKVTWKDSKGVEHEDDSEKWDLYLNAELEDEFGIVRTISDIFHNTRLYYLRKEYEKAGKISEFFKLTSEQLEEKLSDDDSDVWEKALEDVKELQEEYGITGE